MKLRSNLLAGLANSVVTGLLALAVVPFQLKLLGTEAYGLIAFFAMIQASLQLLDVGISPALNRAVAKERAEGRLGNVAPLLRRLGRIYWVVSAVMLVTVVALAPLIATSWLDSHTLSSETVLRSIQLMALVAAARWPGSLYQSVLFGAGRLTKAYLINIAAIIAANVGALVVIYLLSLSIEAFFLWHAGISMCQTLIVKSAAWNEIGDISASNFSREQFRSFVRFAVALGGLAMLGVVFSQLDKWMLSKLLTLESYAHYMLAFTATGALYVFVGPVYNIAYPRFVAVLSVADEAGVWAEYKFFSRLLASVIFPLAAVLAALAPQVLFLWLGTNAFSDEVAPILSLLVVGSALHGVMHVPHALQLAHGNARLPLVVNAALMIAFVPLLLVLVPRYGAFGGAISWMGLHFTYMILSTFLMHREILTGFALKWFITALGPPLVFGVLSGAAAVVTARGVGLSALLSVAMGGCLAVIAIALGLRTLVNHWHAVTDDFRTVT